MEFSIFNTRLQALTRKALSIDVNTLPRISSQMPAGHTLTPDQRNILCVGLVLTTLCGGTPRLQTPFASTSPTSVAAIQSSLRWAMACVNNPLAFQSLMTDLESDRDYVEDLYNTFQPMSFASLVGTVGSLGLSTQFTDTEYSEQTLAEWAYMACINILSFCAARDINPFD